MYICDLESIRRYTQNWLLIYLLHLMHVEYQAWCQCKVQMFKLIIMIYLVTITHFVNTCTSAHQLTDKTQVFLLTKVISIIWVTFVIIVSFVINLIIKLHYIKPTFCNFLKYITPYPCLLLTTMPYLLLRVEEKY